MTKKTFTAPMSFKAAGDSDRAFEAVFATLNQVDLQNDVTLPGAFKGGQAVIIEGFNHDRGLPVGKGTIREEGNEAIVSGQFFDTRVGQEHYEAVRAMGVDQQWSYTFDVLKSRPGVLEGRKVRYLLALDVFGVGPVMRAAGVGTRLTAIKGSSQTTAELVARIKQAELCMVLAGAHPVLLTDRRPEPGTLDYYLDTKAGPELSPAEIVRQIWYAHGLAEGHSLAYLRTIEAARIAAAEQAQWEQQAGLAYRYI